MDATDSKEAVRKEIYELFQKQFEMLDEIRKSNEKIMKAAVDLLDLEMHNKTWWW